MRQITLFTTSVAALLLATSAWGQESASLSASTSEGVNASKPSEEFDQAPFEFGAFAGALFLSSSHNLFQTTHLPFKSPSLELGGRAAGYPVKYFGIELEAAGSPVTADGGLGVMDGLFVGRGHLIGQLPLKGFSLFALFGAGALTVASNQTGSDTDPALHFGVGGKLALSELLALRLDLRDTLSQKFGAAQNTLTHSPEILLGLSFSARTDRRVVTQTASGDSDADGIADDQDACSRLAGPAPSGCPDTDADGVSDDKDACPNEAGSKSGCGCPLKDSDGDRFVDELDRCPNEPGPVEGCKDNDADRDGVVGDADKCPNKPETSNGFEDGDGCPDVVPERVKQFAGVIQGIEFDRNGERIRPGYTATVDNAVLVMKEFPSLRIMISGHTDTDGTRQYNEELSLRRANTVKAYLVSKGIDSSRIETRGAAFDEPIADNDSKEGKQKNRRIEFKLLEGAGPSAAAPAPAPAKP
ncbi:MAG TPA: OmpA family protein, partial [Polyangiaceae bacterium]|nr:OmpA family protein [Polyangiaceae bacterium]